MSNSNNIMSDDARKVFNFTPLSDNRKVVVTGFGELSEEMKKQPFFNQDSRVKLKINTDSYKYLYDVAKIQDVKEFTFDSAIKFKLNKKINYTKSMTLIDYIIYRLFELNNRKLNSLSINEKTVEKLMLEIMIVSPLYKEATKNQISLNKFVDLLKSKEGCLLALSLYKSNLIATRTPIASLPGLDNSRIFMKLEEQPLFEIFKDVVKTTYGFEQKRKNTALEELYSNSILIGQDSKYPRISIANYLNYVCSVAVTISSTFVLYPISDDVFSQFANYAAAYDIMKQVPGIDKYNYYDILKEYNSLELTSIMRGTPEYWDYVKAYLNGSVSSEDEDVDGKHLHIAIHQLPDYLKNDENGFLTGITNYARSIFLDQKDLGFSMLKLARLNDVNQNLEITNNMIIKPPRYSNFIGAYHVMSKTGTGETTVLSDVKERNDRKSSDVADNVLIYGMLDSVKSSINDLLNIDYSELLPRTLSWLSELHYKSLIDIKQQSIVLSNNDFCISAKTNSIINNIIKTFSDSVRYDNTTHQFQFKVKFFNPLNDSQILNWNLLRTLDIAEYFVAEDDIDDDLLQNLHNPKQLNINGVRINPKLYSSRDNSLIGLFDYVEPKIIPFDIDKFSVLNYIPNELPNTKLNITALKTAINQVMLSTQMNNITLNSLLKAFSISPDDNDPAKPVLGQYNYKILSKFTPDDNDVLIFRIMDFCFETSIINEESDIVNDLILDLPEIGASITFKDEEKKYEFVNFVLNQFRNWLINFIDGDRTMFRSIFTDYSKVITSMDAGVYIVQLIMGIFAIRANKLITETQYEVIKEKVMIENIYV